MTQDEIIRMARECGDWNGQTAEFNDVGLERFAALVAEATKHECYVAAMKAAEAAVDVAIEATKEKAAKVCMKQQYDLRTRQTFAAAIREMK